MKAYYIIVRRKYFLLIVLPLAILFLSVGGYFGFRFYKNKLETQKHNEEVAKRNEEITKYKKLIAEFNDSQWQKYDIELRKVEKAAEPVSKCRHQIDSLKDTLLDNYKLTLKKRSNSQDLTSEEQYQSQIYEFLKEFSERLYSWTYHYDISITGKRKFEPDIFIVDKPDNYNESKYQKEKVDAEKSYTRKIESLKEELGWIERPYCPKLPTSIKYSSSVETCIEMVKAKNSLEDKPLRINYELEEEFLLKVSEEEKRLNNEIKGCNEIGFNNMFHSF